MHIQPNLSFSFPTLRIYIYCVCLFILHLFLQFQNSREHIQNQHLSTLIKLQNLPISFTTTLKISSLPLSILYFFSLNNKERTHLMSGFKIEKYLVLDSYIYSYIFGGFDIVLDNTLKAKMVTLFIFAVSENNDY